jgi:long-chain acyl-CoA synthetase
VFEKIQAYARNRAREAGRARVFAVAEATAVAYSRALDAGGPSRALRASHALCDRLVYRGVRAVLGGRARFVISGGAPLDPRTGHFFRGAGLIVLEGWGLTETAAAATVNRVHNPRIGSVGQPLAGVTIRVEDDGEVLVRGPMVFTGYHGDEAGTRAVFDRDGFLRTGDLGRLDDDGFLTITGRKKELLVTAAGKNVAPAPLEERVRANPLVSQVLVVGDRRPFVACLVTIDGDAFRAWKARHRKPAAATVTDLRADPALRGAIQGAVDDANRAVSQAESIKVFAILPVDFSVSSGELTPTLKIRRGVILDRYSGAVDAIYGG